MMAYAKHNVAYYLIVLSVIPTIGCHRYHLTVDDVFRPTAGPCVLAAHIEAHAQSGRRTPYSGAMVRFFNHDQLVGQARTDSDGVAALSISLPEDVTHYRAEADVQGERCTMEGLLFSFPRDRTVIVCDIDGTISMTHYRELVLDSRDDMWSKPFPDSAEVLTELSARFGLVYLTARPGFLLEKTKRWLRANGFPVAPVVTTPGLAQSLGVEKFKSGRIMYFKRLISTVGIGIGNADTDSEAYAMNDLLPLLIDDRDTKAFRSHAIVLKNWRSVQAFFHANDTILSNPDRLKRAG
ncbi:MAG: hypothetical protein HZA51_18620 [Planctomycetes bacterium]|nr:hypothetical protein [Planctomycetota bacterium]